MPTYDAELYGYGTVIGTGNAVMGWFPEATIVKGLIVPGIPHPLLCPEANAGWGQLRAGFEQARQQIIDMVPSVC